MDSEDLLTDEFGRLVRECFNCCVVGCKGCDGKRTCPGCGHAEHSGFCRWLVMDGPPGDVDECGCLDDRENKEDQ